MQPAKVNPWSPDASEQKLKEEYAELLLRRGLVLALGVIESAEYMNCAKIVSNNDFALSWSRSKTWVNDPYVKSHQKYLIETFGMDNFMPSRYEMFHKLWSRVHGMGDGDFIRGMQLALETQGFVGKNGPTGERNDPIHTVTRIELVAPEPKMKVIEHEAVG